jgi:mono/diheme cytochrome c family protein
MVTERSAMKRVLVISILVLATAGMTVAARAQDRARDATFGRMTFAGSCAICHAIDARGSGAMTPNLVVPPPDLTGLSRQNGGTFPEDYVREVITSGAGVTTHGGQMPAWGLIFLQDFDKLTIETQRDDSALVRRRIDELIAYLRSIQTSED